MYKIYTLFSIALFLIGSSVNAQSRYIDSLFGVSEPTTLTYGQNITVNPPGLQSLEAEVYEPVGEDTTALRPIVVVFPTGNFLEQYQNRGSFGSLRDSAAVEIVERLVSSGYVGMIADYRTGWLPQAEDQEIRTRTLLQAAYRGGQDAHTLSRYLRKTVVEEDNPFRIDTNRIVFWGLGTGGYVTMTHAFLDDINEVLDEDRFRDSEGNPFVTLAVNGDPQGLMPAAFPEQADGSTPPSNIPNHPGYGSDVAMAINANGALGELNWMTGADNEPLTLGFHSPTDPFAPFSVGTVVVPTTDDIVITGVSGTESTVERANDLGLNDAIAAANDVNLPSIFSDLSRAVNATNAQYKQVDVDLTLLGQAADVDLSHDNMFPLSVGDMRTSTRAVGATYNWIDSSAVRAEVAVYNEMFDQEEDADAIIGSEILTNPNAYDAAGARLVIDTMMAYFIPRAYIGMNLGDLVSTNDLIANEAIDFKVVPNPASDQFQVETATEFPIRAITVFDINGRVAATYRGINQNRFTVPRNNLPRGTYLVQLQLDEGVTVRKVILE